MKLSVSTWAFFDKGREEALARIAAMGVEGIELIAHQPCFHVDVDFNERMVGYVRGLLAAHGLKISAISPATEFLVFEEAEMAAQLKHMRKVADLAPAWAPITRASLPAGACPRIAPRNSALTRSSTA